MNYINTNPFSHINIYEYEEISSLKSTKILSQIFTTSNIDNKLMLWSNYSISSYSTKYFCLEIKPNYNISYLVVQIDVDSNDRYDSYVKLKNLFVTRLHMIYLMMFLKI